MSVYISIIIIVIFLRSKFSITLYTHIRFIGMRLGLDICSSLITNDDNQVFAVRTA